MKKYVDIWGRLLYQWLWTTFYYIFTTIQRFVWLFTGTYWTIRGNRLLSNYQRSAQVLKIIGRHRFHGFYPLNWTTEFLTVHKCFDTPERVLQDHVSIYMVTDDEAIFVEAPPGCELWKSSYNPFFHFAQFRHAVGIIRMPISSFHRIADELGDPSNLTFLAHVGRTGSTLVAQMFEQTGDVVTMAHPLTLYCLDKKTPVNGALDKSTERLFISTVRLFCKPTTWKEKGHVIKLPNIQIHLTPLLMSLFPRSHCCFLYRDGFKVAQSRYRMIQSFPEQSIYKASGRLEIIFLLIVKLLKLNVINYKVLFRSSCNHPLIAAATQWAEKMELYRQWRESGLPVVGIRYEDIIAEPESNMRRILRHCGLPEQSAVNSLRALEVDSQSGTPLSRQALRHIAVPEYAGEIKAELDEMCQFYGLPAFSSGPYVAPGTITSV